MGSIRRFVAIAAMSAVSIGTAAAVPATAATSRGNIVQTAAGAGQFKTLIKLAEQAGLARALEGKESLTVFAPTDAAFAKLPRATVAALEHNRRELRAVLLYHVIKGRFTAAQLVRLHSVKTLDGQSLTVKVRRGTVTVGGIRVVKADVAAANGIIHVIGGVLIPR